jgi:hypothetical protein
MRSRAASTLCDAAAGDQHAQAMTAYVSPSAGFAWLGGNQKLSEAHRPRRVDTWKDSSAAITIIYRLYGER